MTKVVGSILLNSSVKLLTDLHMLRSRLNTITNTGWHGLGSSRCNIAWPTRTHKRSVCTTQQRPSVHCHFHVRYGDHSVKFGALKFISNVKPTWSSSRKYHTYNHTSPTSLHWRKMCSTPVTISRRCQPHCLNMQTKSLSVGVGDSKLDLQLIANKHGCIGENFMDVSDSETGEIMVKDIVVLDNFISEEEETRLYNEVHRYLKKMRYEFDHWDDAIHGFRELERSDWTEQNQPIIERIREVAFPIGSPHIGHVHVLDLAEDGCIKPHVDSIRFCGRTIAGLSLLSPCVMRFVHQEKKASQADVLLKRRSLYIMKDKVRLEYTHEVLDNEHSIFKGEKVPKTRRISVICRTEPITEDIAES